MIKEGLRYKKVQYCKLRIIIFIWIIINHQTDICEELFAGGTAGGIESFFAGETEYIGPIEDKKMNEKQMHLTCGAGTYFLSVGLMILCSLLKM